MPKLLLPKELSIDNHFHGKDVSGLQEIMLENETLYMIILNPGTYIILSLDQDYKISLGLSIAGEMRYIAFDEMSARKMPSTLEYSEKSKGIRLSIVDQTTGTKHVLEAYNPDKKKKLVNYKVKDTDMDDLQAAIINHPRVKELIEFIIKKLNETDPNIVELLKYDKRFAKMLELSKKPVKTTSESVIDYYFLESGILEDGIELPEEFEK